MKSLSPIGSWGPPKDLIARTALKNLVDSNPELWPIFVDNSHSPSPSVSAGYFQVLVEVFTAQPLPIERHVVVSLVFHKVVDTRQDVRDAARTLLSVLTRRVWKRETKYNKDVSESLTDQAATVVVGALTDSHHSYQLYLTARLAREHPELGADLVIEVLRRQIASPSGQWQLIKILRFPPEAELVPSITSLCWMTCVQVLTCSSACALG
jgi:hypothetical protein